MQTRLSKLNEQQAKTVIKLVCKDILRWIEYRHIKTESGALLDFDNHKFLEAIYDDKSPFICAMKAAQIGFTTYEILKTAHEAYYDNIDIIYVLPTADDVKQFSGGKTNRIIDNNHCLQEWTNDKDSVEQKKFGRATVYYRGSWTERTAIMITAQKLVIDELDRCKPEIVEQYDSRLQAITNPRKAFFSNPSIPDFGIDKFYKLSDQKKWHITHSCGHRFVFDEACIDYTTEIYRCPKCAKEITDDERRNGKWIATSKGEWSGYWIPLWINPLFSAQKIAKYKKEKSAEYFSNFVAGLPYVGSGNKVSAQTIIGCLDPKVNDQKARVIIGVDTGLPIHYVCANKNGFFYYGKCSDPKVKDPYTELEALLVRWPSSIMIADQGGDLIGIRNLQTKYPGRVYLCWYRADRKTPTLIQWGEGSEYGKVIVDRNRTIQQFIDEMNDKRWKYNGTEADWHEFITHWLNIYREWEYDDSGLLDKEKGFKWARSGADHFCHACWKEDTLITTENGQVKIKDIKVGDYVLTRNGFEKVTFSGLIKNADTLELSLATGEKLIGTPEHKIWTENNGWKELQYLTTNDILVSTWNNNLTTKYIASTQGKDIYQEQGVKECTEKCGSIIMGLYQKASMFTIKIAIQSTMKLITWNWLMQKHIWHNMPEINLLRTLYVKFAVSSISRKTRELIVFAHLNANGITPIEPIIMWKGYVKSVKNNLPPIMIKNNATVLKHAQISTIADGTKNIPVYGITVENSHEYFANNLLVSNSVYARVGLDKFQDQMAQIVGDDLLDGLPYGRSF